MILAILLAALPFQESSPETKEIARLEEAYNTAHLAGDAAALDALWADDSMITVPGMAVMGKSAAVGSLSSGRIKFTRYETSAVKIRVLGATAIVSGRLQRTRKVDDRVFEDDWQFTKDLRPPRREVEGGGLPRLGLQTVAAPKVHSALDCLSETITLSPP